MTPDTPRDAALTYAARFGWPVLATNPADKSPLLAHGVLDASTDPGVIAGWYARWPDANVAVATGAPGPLVLDIDHPELAPAAILALHTEPEAITGRTDDVGRHLYYAGVEQRTRKWPWGELRGTGSYVVAPPSTHSSGNPYAWAAEPNGALAPVPPVLLELVEDRDREPFRRRTGVGHGERHTYLEGYALHLVAVEGFRDRDAITVELAAEFARACVPEPAPRSDEFTSLARWVAGTELMARVRHVDAAAAHLTEALTKPRVSSKRPPDHAASLDEVRDFLTAPHRFPPGWRIESAVRFDGDGNDPMTVYVRHPGGLLEVRFERQRDASRGPSLAAIFAEATRGMSLMVPLAPKAAIPYYGALMRLADVIATRSAADEARDWLNTYLAHTEQVHEHSLATADADERLEALLIVKRRPPFERTQADTLRRGDLLLSGHPTALVDAQTGEWWVRTSEMVAYVRHVIGPGGTLPQHSLDARMREIGVAREVLYVDHRRVDGGGEQARGVFYRVPVELAPPAPDLPPDPVPPRQTSIDGVDGR